MTVAPEDRGPELPPPALLACEMGGEAPCYAHLFEDDDATAYDDPTDPDDPAPRAA